jgi:beta-lactamase class A
VYVLPATGTSGVIGYRADERFAFCSTFKAPLVAAVLQRYPLSHLDQVVTYTGDDIKSASPVTEQHVGTGMTIGQLGDAAIRYSDGTAANLLLADIGGLQGGPAAFTAYLRGLGDTVSRLDQDEPELNRNAPDDERDTTTPHAIAHVFQQLVLGDALPPDKRAMLTDWMARSTTGAKRIRAAFPADWRVIDKTGSGDYGRTNDVAVVWSPDGVPHVLAIYSDFVAGGFDAQPNDAFVADAALIVAAALGGE